MREYMVNENPGRTVLLGNFGKKCARSSDFLRAERAASDPVRLTDTVSEKGGL